MGKVGTAFLAVTCTTCEDQVRCSERSSVIRVCVCGVLFLSGPCGVCVLQIGNRLSRATGSVIARPVEE